jgi:hypothetical protein
MLEDRLYDGSLFDTSDHPEMCAAAQTALDLNGLCE